MLWRFGFDLFKVKSAVSVVLKKFENIYTIQVEGRSFADVEDMLRAMGGEDLYSLTQVSANDHMIRNLHWNRRLVDELIQCIVRVNYGQGTTVNAFTAYVALAGMENGKLWSVVGGNWQIAQKVLEASGASLVMDDVVCVKKIEDGNGKVKFTIFTEDGTVTEDFDVVIVANPLNISSIKYENFSSDVYTAAATTPYQRTVATLANARINQEFFGVGAKKRNFPLVILTSGMEGSPFQFNSVAAETPSDITQDDVSQFTRPLHEDQKRVWKVFSPKPLTQAQLQTMFIDIDMTDVNDWQAYPHYQPPEQFPSFVLDDGVYYVNAIEKVASAMEMSVIGAKNAAILAKEYILNCQH